MTDSDLILYYANLLILQYRNKPKAYAMVQACLQILVIYQLLIAVRDGYDINTAVGAQLDVLAKYVGVDRQVTGTDFTKIYFGLVPYGSTFPVAGISGFKKYGDAISTSAFKTYLDNRQPLFSMTDDQLRRAIQGATVVNRTDCTLKYFDDNISLIIDGQLLLSDNQDMSITYTVPTAYKTDFLIAKDTGKLIRPAGIIMNVVYV